MAALGDSVTRAFAACGRSGDCVETSWATGTIKDLDSHAQRLTIANPDRSHNLAVSGARVSGLASQVEAAVWARPDYVTVLIGANDACTPTEAAMTSVEEYTGAFNAALNALVRGLPNAHILVLSVPDLARLWEVGRDYPEVRRVWDSYGICQSMLADPTDITAGAQARRDRVRARIQAYNAAMTAACARHTPTAEAMATPSSTTDSTSKTSVRAITGTRANAVRPVRWRCPCGGVLRAQVLAAGRPRQQRQHN
jgi:lysophospholipase L1-like esterase